MVYSGYLLPKSNSSSTIKSEQNSSNLNNTNTTNTTNNVSNHLKHTKKLSSIGSTSNRSSESSRFNETSSNVTIKSDLNKFNKNPRLAPEILFLIKEHAKTLETINQISKKLQEIEIKVDDISQRLSSRENSLNSNDNNFNKNLNIKNRTDQQQIQKNNQLNDSQSHQKELNQTRLPYSSNYKDIDHLSNNLSNNATNIPNNQILSDDSGGEYGNKTTTKTVSDDDELLSILDKITKCSHHILQTQQAYQQQGTAIYNSLSKPYAYNNGLISNPQFNNNNTNNQLNHAGHLQQQQLNIGNNLQNGRHDFYNTQSLYQTNPYLLNAKINQSQIKPTAIITNQPHQSNISQQQQQQTLIPLKYSNQQQASLNELLFEPNVERFLSNLDQLVCNDDTANLAAILGTNQQTNTHLINSQNNLPIAILPNQQPQFIQVSPHQTSTPISSQPMPILQTSNNLRNNYNLNNILQTSINQQQQQQFLNNNNNNISLHNTSPNNIQNQQFLNWQRAKELLEKKEKERIDNQIKEADEWLTTVDHCINRNKYQSSKNKQLNNTKERDKK